MPTPSKPLILAALAAHVNQRPRLEPGNYISGPHDDDGRRAYRAEARRIAQDGRTARELLRLIALHPVTADELTEATRRAYMGRLSLHADPRGLAVEYTPGQYWPTEYRRAAVAVLGSALWHHYAPAAADRSAVLAKLRAVLGSSLLRRTYGDDAR